MENVLLDTCSWINLLNEDNNDDLSHLEFWIENKYINLITHEIIIEEWNNHKEKGKNQITQSLKAKYKHANEVIKKENLFTRKIEPNYKVVDDQIGLIDKIINSALCLKTTDDIKVYCSDKAVARKAPFHNNSNNTKDALIIYSALKHL